MKSVLSLLCAASLSLSAAAPLALHPDNPHYFKFRGQPTVLITSGEHYGAVLNRDFNYAKYLATLEKDGLNLTRTFSGSYMEPAGAFNIANNTLAPGFERLICPWARSSTLGYAGGGEKFDLTRWDAEYFARLKDFVATAGRHGVVVEMNLFCPFYDESQWRLSPQNAINNINGVGNIARTNAYTLDQNGNLLAVQEALVRKIVTELKNFDNVYYEVCNEPYFGGVTMAWQKHIAEVISQTEKGLGVKHLISMNIANDKARVTDPSPAVSIFNFHYATPPVTVEMNYALNKPIGDNETGFKGTNNTHYRMEGWQFILAGGALYNNLDYSFTVGHEDGTYVYPKSQPGGGNPVFRRELRTLRDFIHRFDFIHMKPAPGVVAGGVPEKGRVYVLAEDGRQYAIYLFGGNQADLQLSLPAGNYGVEWVFPVTGKTVRGARLHHAGGTAKLTTPTYDQDLAIRLTRVS
jgi:hypothetical protein